jgi:dipeptidyl-peptidase-3
MRASTLNLLLLCGCSAAGQQSSDRKWLLETVDDAAVVQLYADGFDGLSHSDKLLAFHLTQAAIAGRDIFLDQKYRHALELRDFLEELYLQRAKLEPAFAAELTRYLKLFWINNGPHHNLTARKFVLQAGREQVLAAAAAAEKAGAKLSRNDGEAAASVVDRLYPILADPDVDPIVTSKSPGPGRDVLQASCNNLYEGVTVKDLEGFAERYPLNSKLVKRDGKLVELVYRCGDGTVPPGLYAKELAEVVRHMEAALPHAPEKTAAALRHLIRFFRTGDPEDFRKYNIAWVADTASTIDTVIGFIEVYLDARGQKGAFEGIVSYINPAKTPAIKKIASEAAWFEQRMPWEDRFKKPDVKGIIANAIEVVVETGDSGPVTPVGINLPNAQDIREQYGSKSVSLANVVEAYDQSTPDAMRKEFCWSEEEFLRAKKWSSASSELHTNLHEVIGHASGRTTEKVGADPAKFLGELYSTLEEARADLVALYFITDPKLEELGLVPEPDMALSEYESYTRNALVQLRRVRTGAQLEQDHMRNRQLIVHWLMAHTKAIETKERDGKTYYVVADAQAWKEGSGRLLAEVMRIKAEGDMAAGRALVEGYGVKFDPKLRDQVVARVSKLGIPSYTGFVQPELRAVRGAGGEVTDVKIEYPCDLAKQMLGWSGRGERAR